MANAVFVQLVLQGPSPTADVQVRLIPSVLLGVPARMVFHISWLPLLPRRTGFALAVFLSAQLGLSFLGHVAVSRTLCVQLVPLVFISLWLGRPRVSLAFRPARLDFD